MSVQTSDRTSALGESLAHFKICTHWYMTIVFGQFCKDEDVDYSDSLRQGQELPERTEGNMLQLCTMVHGWLK